jgi:tetratricopeptide (TPR) repeat protein
MKHVSESRLGQYAVDPGSVSNRLEMEAHLAACKDCRDALKAVRAFDASLREPESWTGMSGAMSSRDELRAFAVRAAAEDEAALQLLEEFREPAAAARFVWTDISRKRKYQTGGVARLLCKWANRMCQRDPLYALRLAEAASIISAGLPDASYPRDAVHDLRGEGQKEQANALRFLGRFPEALHAIALAEAEYRKLSHEGIGLVAVQYVRGCIQYEQEELEAAERSAHEAAEAALHLGAADRYMGARHLLGHVLFDRRDYTAAAAVFESILRYGEERGDLVWRARESLAAGGCYLELGRKADASRYLHEALRLFTELDFGSEVTRTHWTIARLLFAEGHTSEAIYRLRRTIAEFTRYEMLADAGVVAVDLAEMLNATGRLREIPKALANVVRTFIDAGKLNSALTALAYLKEAARAGTLTPQLLAYVRRFVIRTERQPELLFVPPPPEPL